MPRTPPPPGGNGPSRRTMPAAVTGGTGMTPDQVRDTADRARHIYDQRLRAVLEADHPGRFVAVEPDSGDHFLADTLDAAAAAAQAAHPARRAHVLRVGHPVALHIGGAWL